jgi:hypothetical protein
MDRGYIVKLNSEGSALIYASYISAAPRSVAADRTGQAYVAGQSWGQLATTAGALQPLLGGRDKRERGMTDIPIRPMPFWIRQKSKYAWT